MTGLEAESVLEREAVPEQQEVTSVCALPLEPDSPEVVLSEGEFAIGAGIPPEEEFGSSPFISRI